VSSTPTTATATARSTPGQDTAARRARRTAYALELLGTYAVLGVFLFIGLFPFFWMVRTGLTPRQQSFSLHPSLFPTAFTLDNFTRVLTSPTIPFATQFRNSTVVALGTTALVILAGVWGAYALARLRFRGKQAFSVSLLLIQLFPGVLLIIPMFVVMVNLHLANSLFGLMIAYSTSNLPFVVWLLRGYFLAIPQELEDAARIDGCTSLGVIFRVVLPVAAPGIAAAATLAFVNAWNEFLFAYVLINDDTKRVLAVGLSGYIDQFSTDYSGLFAMATLTTLPVVLVFMVFQRYLVGGLAAGAVKG